MNFRGKPYKLFIVYIAIVLVAGCVNTDALKPQEAKGGNALLCLINPSDPSCPQTEAQKCVADPTRSGCYDPTNTSQVLGLAHHVQIESAATGNANFSGTSIIVGQSLTLYLAAYDAQGDYLAQVPAIWSVANAFGTITAGSVSSATFVSTGLGTETITATTSTGLSDTSGNIVISGGTLASIRISSATGAGAAAYETASITTDNSVTLYALGFDASNNYLGQVAVNWSFVNDKGSFANGSDTNTVNASTSVTFYANQATGVNDHAVIRATSGAITDDTGTTVAGIQISLGALASLKIRSANNNGGAEYNSGALTTDQSVTLYSAGYDADGNFLGNTSVDWSFVNDKGSYSAANDTTNTVTAATSATFYANQLTGANDHAVIRITSGAITDDTGTTASGIQITAGALASLKIRTATGNGGSEYNSGALTTDQSVTLYAAGYDADGNYKGDTSVDWSFVNDKGSFSNIDDTTNTVVAASSTTFYANHATAVNDHAVIRVTSGAITDDTGTTASGIQITLGALASLKIRTASGNGGSEYNTASIDADQNVTLYAAGYDADGNYKGEQSVDWSFVNDKGSFSNANDTTDTVSAASSATFYANHLTGVNDHAVIRVTSGAITDDTGTTAAGIQISAGALASIKINSSAGAAGVELNTYNMNADQTVTLYASEYDADGNYRQAGSADWTMSNRKGLFGGTAKTVSAATSVVFHANIITSANDHGVVVATLGAYSDATGTKTNGIQITAGALASIKIAFGNTSSDGEVFDYWLNQGSNVNLFANSYDADGNFKAPEVVTWSMANNNGTFNVNNTSSVTFTANMVNNTEVISITNGVQSDSTSTFTIGTSGEMPVNPGQSLTEANQICNGQYHGCAAMRNGKVRCWGANADFSNVPAILWGQLGINSSSVYSQINAPFDVQDDMGGTLSGVKKVGCGRAHTCALKYNGEVKCWGMNGVNQIGNGTTNQSLVATRVLVGANDYLDTATDISVGYDATCAIVNEGGNKLRCWGLGTFGQMGDGSSSNNPYAAFVKVNAGADLTNVTSVAVGNLFACARLNDSTVTCWGNPTNGELGNNDIVTTYNYASQFVIDNDTNNPLNNATAVYSGPTNTTACAVLADATAKCWGKNWFGHVGNVASIYNPNVLKATTVTTDGATALANVSTITLSEYAAHGLLVNGTVKAWGHNRTHTGARGCGSTCGADGVANSFLVDSDRATTQANVTQIAGGGGTCALFKPVGLVKCWGDNEFFQLGSLRTKADNDAAFTDVMQFYPGQNNDLANVIQVAVGGKMVCALKSDNTVQCWGQAGAHGNVGSNSNPMPGLPGNVKLGNNTDLGSVVQIDAGDKHACARKNDGSVWCWGDNGGSLADNSNTIRPYAINGFIDAGSVTNITGTDWVAAGGGGTCATYPDGTIKCWGSNNKTFALGAGVTSRKYADNALTGVGSQLTGVDNMVSIGDQQTCVLMADTSVRCFGEGTSGRLGNNGVATIYYASTTVNNSGGTPFTGFTKVSTFSTNTCGILTDQTVTCWGSRTDYALGDNSAAGSVNYAGTLVQTGVGNLSGVLDIAVGYHSACAIVQVGADRRVTCWGDGKAGQMGDNSYTNNQVANSYVLNQDLSMITDADQIDAYDGTYCVKTAAGKAKCWGTSSYFKIWSGVPQDFNTSVAMTIKQ